jgi:proteasome lid subunit RPN8/RPN11
MSTTIEFSIEAYEAIVAHAREGVPREVCGVLGGTRCEHRGRSGKEHSGKEHREKEDDAEPGTTGRVRSIHRAENVARSPRRTYLIDPEEQLAIMERIEEEGAEVVGFYHSHPSGPAGPSGVDERRATWDGYSYAICLPEVPFIGSWRWDGETFTGEVVSLR